MHALRTLAAASFLAGVLVVAGCSDRERPPASPPATGANTPGTAASVPSDPAAILRLAQAAVDHAGGYRVEVTARNFVLPQWGGSDSGEVHVGKDGRSARAVLSRAGEGGPYTLSLIGGQTYFKRATCPTWSRVPGGGADVLAPFLLVRERLLERAESPALGTVAPGELAVVANLPGIGVSTVYIDPATMRPRRILLESTSSSATRLNLGFSEWGQDAPVEKPFGAIPDRGPGGNPC